MDDARMARYGALLLARNRALNLTAARDEAAVAAHIEDALALRALLREPFVDVGSGGGFPAIPLAIATGFRGTLIESLAKKTRFLREVAEELGLPLAVLAARAEDVAREEAHREAYASATARAVATLPTVMELTIPLLAVGGVALLQRGQIDVDERTAAHDAALVLGCEIVEEIAVGDRRSIVVVIKRMSTGLRFPRRAGVPAKRPLCLDAKR